MNGCSGGVVAGSGHATGAGGHVGHILVEGEVVGHISQTGHEVVADGLGQDLATVNK